MPSNIFWPRDPTSGNLLILDAVHGAIHDGVHFTAHHSVTVGAATAVTVLIQAPATSSSAVIHFVGAVEANKGGTWTFSEEPVTTGGSAIVSYNNDRESATASPATLKHTVTVDVASVGTILETHIVGAAGTNQSKVGGNATQRNEWELARGKSYLIRFVATDSATIVSVHLPYYYRNE